VQFPLHSSFRPLSVFARSGTARKCLVEQSTSESQSTTANTGLDLDERVAQSLRKGRRHVEVWRRHCERWGDGRYDPAHYDAAFLEDALKVLDATVFNEREDETKRELVNKVKQWRRQGRRCARAWEQYCRQNGDGFHDPDAHDVAFLQTAITELQMKEMPGGEAHLKRVLVDKVKQWMRRNDAGNEFVWREFCNKRGDGVLDPGAHSIDFLEAAIAKMTNRGRGLVQQVKQWQQLDPANAEAWRQYCDTHGQGNYFPKAHSTAFLKQALAALTSNQRGNYQDNSIGGVSWE